MSNIRIDTSGILPLISRISPANERMTHTVAIQVKKDTVPYVPMRTGSQVQRTRVSGSKIIYEGPYARYLYKGKVMEGPLHGPKHATDRDLDISKSVHQKATAHWFEESKKANINTWKKVARRAFLDGVRR